MLLHKWRNKKGTQENHHVTVCYICVGGRNKKQVFCNAPSFFSQNHACQACNRKEVSSRNSVRSLTRHKYMNKLSFYACNPCCDMCGNFLVFHINLIIRLNYDCSFISILRLLLFLSMFLSNFSDQKPTTYFHNFKSK